MSDHTPNDPNQEPTPPGGAPPPPPSSGGGAPPPPPGQPGQPGGWNASAPQPSAAGQSADVGIRIGARLIDFVLLWIVYMIIFVPLVIAMAFSDVSGFGFGFGIGDFIVGLLGAVIYVGYFAYLESSRDQTVGKMILNLRTVDEHGNNPSFEVAAKRNAWLALSIIPWLGWLLQLAAAIYILVTINNDPNNRGWHDQFAGTAVVRTR